MIPVRDATRGRVEPAERSFLERTVLPVLDLIGGQVVRGIGGHRNEYRPVVSQWTKSSDPLCVARALQDAFGFRRFYVADLDAITSGHVRCDAVRSLASAGFELIVDAGVRTASDAMRLLDAGVQRVILGLESFESPEHLTDVISAMNRDVVTFSLDLKQGRPIADPSRWPSNPLEIVDFVCSRGIDQLIILDLAAVGMQNGLVTGDLCRQVSDRLPAATIITGGGIRTEAEVESAIACGADFVLMATALHDGSLMPRTCHAS